MNKEKEVYEAFAKAFIHNIYDVTIMNIENIINENLGNLSTKEALESLSEKEKEATKYICSEVVEYALGNVLIELKEKYYDEKLKIHILRDGSEYDIIKIAQQHTYGHINGEFHIEGGWIDRYSELTNHYRYFREDKTINPLEEWWIEEAEQEEEPKTKAEWEEYERNFTVEKKNKETIEYFSKEKDQYYKYKKLAKGSIKDQTSANYRKFYDSSVYLKALYITDFDEYKGEVDFINSIDGNIFSLIGRAIEPLYNDYCNYVFNQKFIIHKEIVGDAEVCTWYMNILEENEKYIDEECQDFADMCGFTYYYDYFIYPYKVLGNQEMVDKYTDKRAHMDNLLQIVSDKRFKKKNKKQIV